MLGISKRIEKYDRPYIPRVFSNFERRAGYLTCSSIRQTPSGLPHHWFIFTCRVFHTMLWFWKDFQVSFTLSALTISHACVFHCKPPVQSRSGLTTTAFPTCIYTEGLIFTCVEGTGLVWIEMIDMLFSSFNYLIPFYHWSSSLYYSIDHLSHVFSIFYIYNPPLLIPCLSLNSNFN